MEWFLADGTDIFLLFDTTFTPFRPQVFIAYPPRSTAFYPLISQILSPLIANAQQRPLRHKHENYNKQYDFVKRQ